MRVYELIKEMKQSGVMGAGRLAKAAEILELMIKDRQCTVFLGMAGAMVPGGMKNIIIEMLENDNIDVFVTTGANLTHDLVEALWIQRSIDLRGRWQERPCFTGRTSNHEGCLKEVSHFG